MKSSSAAQRHRSVPLKNCMELVVTGIAGLAPRTMSRSAVKRSSSRSEANR